MSHYCLHCGKGLDDWQYVCPECHHNVYIDSLDDIVVQASSGILSAINIETNTQWAKYHCGKDGCVGHGFAAEDVNTFHDFITGANVEAVGRNNEKNGPDRIVNGEYIQTKYCSTPKATVESFFDKESGLCKYNKGDGVQTLEVPSDQYDDCVALMEQKIRDGKVPGVTDTNKAKSIIRRGSCTYKQAKNIARAGNVDSLLFDIKTGAVIALSSLGVSFCVKLGVAALSCRSTEDLKAAIQLSFLDGLKSGAITLSTSVLTTQLVKTQFGRDFVVLIQKVSKGNIDAIYGTEVGRKMVHDIASGLWKKTITGASAKNVVIKLVRINAVTGLASFLVTSIPDTYHCFIGQNISKPQFIKNMVVNATSMAGMTIGGILGLKLGPYGAMGGAMVGGAVVGMLTKTIADKITPDDSVHMHELLKIALLELSNDFLIQNQVEFEAVIRNISIDRVIDTDVLRAMYAIGAPNNDDRIRVEYVKLILHYQFDVVARQRRTFKMMSNQNVIAESIDSII